MSEYKIVTNEIPKRIFVFRSKKSQSTRQMLFAIPEDEIKEIESQWGSHNVYLKVNGKEVEGSFNEFIDKLGIRVDIE